ncbi:MAG TPA: carboxypeptidase-like regulatory domain-containing protein [Planctomycetota bacterium]|nr:carboxypeptidase-like regulatory domain-containing protein [Planctomycetota bacterium]
MDGVAGRRSSPEGDGQAGGSSLPMLRELPPVGGHGRAERMLPGRHGTRRGGCGGVRVGQGAEERPDDEGCEPKQGQSRGVDASCWYGVCTLTLGARVLPRAPGPAPRRAARPRLAATLAGDGRIVLPMTFGSAGVQGFVVDARTGDGLAGLDVRLSRDGRPVAVTATDDSGAFEFAGLLAGLYDLVCPVGAEPATPAQSVPLDLATGEWVTDLVLEVEPAGPVSADAAPPRSAR